MKLNLPTFFRFLFMAFLVVACTKQVGLYTEVEFELAQDYRNAGYLQDSFATTLSVIPEEDLEDYSYSFTYEVSSGNGYFLDDRGERVPSNENIPFTPFSTFLRYQGTIIGEHVVKIVASDNFGFTEETELRYEIGNIPIVWTATAPVTQVEPGNAVPITLTLENDTDTENVSFESKYTLTSGSGTLTGISTESTGISEEFTAIAPNTYTLSFTADALGTAELVFNLVDSNGQELRAAVTIEVVAEVLDQLAPEINLLGNNPQQLLVNTAYMEIGAEAFDAVDGELTDQIEIDANAVDTGQEGSYEVTYSVTDEAGNTTTAVRTVTVVGVDNTVPVSGISVLPETANIIVGNTQQFTATIEPDNATDQAVLWSSGDTALATVNGNGLVTGVSEGEVTITATSAENGSITDTAIITISTAQVEVETISVTSTRSTITDDQTEQFMAVVGPMNASNTDIVWSSSNNGVATVDASTGLVTAVSAGVTEIIATATDGSGVSGAKEFTVTASQIPVTSITVTRDRSSIPDNETEQFTAVVAPSNATNDTVTWSSSNTAVATVNTSSGLVTAVSAGTTIIEATATDNSGTSGSANLMVMASPIPVTGITVSSTRASIRDDETENFMAVVTPTNASNSTLTWSSSNISVASVNATTGLVTAVSAGTVDIIATATDMSGQSGFKNLTVTSNRAPMAIASADRNSGTAPLPINFTGNDSFDSDTGDIISYSWDFDDGSTSTLANPSHTFSSAGLYTVTLTVSDGNLSDTDTVNVGVTRASNPDFNFSAFTSTPQPSGGYSRGQSIDLDFSISPNFDMPPGATYIMEMFAQRANLRINGNSYRENRNIPMNPGNEIGLFQDISGATADSASVTFTVTETITGITKSRTLNFDYCTGNLCISE